MATPTSWIRLGRLGTHTLPPTLAFALIAGLLAGCTAPSAADRDRPGFPDALAAEGPVLIPDRQEGGTDFRIKLIEPSRPQDAAEGRQRLAFVLYDARDGSPVEDATVFLESWMLDHDHATGEEKDPLHAGSGVYRGETFHAMSGNWAVRLEGIRVGGDAFWLTVRIRVA